MSQDHDPVGIYLGDKSNKHKIKTLIVDDNEMDQMILKEALNKMSLFDIHVASDAQKAKFKIWNAIETHAPYKVIFLDWRMPKIDGLTLYKDLKKSQEVSKVHFIMITGVSDEIEVKKALDTGIKHYILKPFDINLVHKKLREMISPNA